MEGETMKTIAHNYDLIFAAALIFTMGAAFFLK